MINLRVQNENTREFLAEFLGTCTLVTLGCCGNAVINLTNLSGGFGLLAGAINWGLVSTVATYLSGNVSGAHTNPGITVGMASVGKLKWSKVLHYLAGQYLGAFVAAAIVYGVYREAIIETKGVNNSTIAIFASYSAENISTGTVFLDQIISNMFYLLIISAIVDERNMEVPKGLMPVAVGFGDLTLMCISFGYNCGPVLNPARDFSPRVFSAMLGWGVETFSHDGYGYFWTPIVACHIGAIFGCWLYRIVIENHWPSNEMDILKNVKEENKNPK